MGWGERQGPTPRQVALVAMLEALDAFLSIPTTANGERLRAARDAYRKTP